MSYTTNILPEGLDTDRNLVASGGTTLVSSLEVRSSMDRVLTAVESKHTVKAWSLDPGSSLKDGLRTVPGPVEGERIADLRATFLDMGDRLLDSARRLQAAADTAQLFVDQA